MGRRRATASWGAEETFQPDRSRAHRLQKKGGGRRRTAVRNLYRAVVEHFEAGSPAQRRRRRRQLKASATVAVGAGLHMLATMWHRPPPPHEDGLGAAECAIIWGAFWYVVTDMLGMNVTMGVYGTLAVLGLLYSNDPTTTTTTTTTTANDDAEVGVDVGVPAATSTALVVWEDRGFGVANPTLYV